MSLTASLAGNGLMRAVVWSGFVKNVTVQSVPIPIIQNPTDAIVRVTAAGICGTDIHTYHGYLGSATPPWVMGHEAAGVVVEIGSAVEFTRIGDEVVIPDQAHTGMLNMALAQSPSSFGGILGLGSDYGDNYGCQAEYVRVAHADMSLIPIPQNNAADAPSILDYLFVGDIFSTGWTAVQRSGFEAGDTVAVFGGGPVGQLAAYSAILEGASRVYLVDPNPARLALAKSKGAIPISLNGSISAVDQILSHEPNGVTRSVDCVGYEAVNQTLQRQQNAVMLDMVAVTAIHGGIGSIGIYVSQNNSKGVPNGDFGSPMQQFPMAAFYSKGLSFKAGAVDPKLTAPHLMQLIATGRAKPSYIISSKISIEEAPESYKKFAEQDGVKYVIVFE